MSDAPEPTTQLLNRLVAGDASAADALMGVVYDELRVLAEHHMNAQRADHTLQPTALIHEAWLRIGGQENVSFECRAQFFSLASRVMRTVLVDHARAARAEKRKGAREQVPLEGQDAVLPEGVDLVALDDALRRLHEINAQLSRLVELRFFGGLSHPQIAETTGESLRSVERRWRLARAWLHGELAS